MKDRKPTIQEHKKPLSVSKDSIESKSIRNGKRIKRYCTLVSIGGYVISFVLILLFVIIGKL